MNYDMGEIMSRNIVICCDGTGNEIEKDLSNVLKLYRLLKKDEKQIVFYDPGIGTISTENVWTRRLQKAYAIWCLATGTGLDPNVLRAYCFLIDTYKPGDQIFIFGFSRGAYTARVLAGFLHLMGLLKPEQKNLAAYAFKAYKQSSYSDLEAAWGFRQVSGADQAPIHFLGVWDTVSSVLIPRPDRWLLDIDQQRLRYTRTNPSVEIFRQAIAIDEKRRMFQINRWAEPQNYDPNPFNPKDNKPQDIKQVWFAGNHSDVGGGYPEEKSGIAKFSLKWMIQEAQKAGLRINTAQFNHLVLGKPRQGGKNTYTPPEATAPVHNSMTWGWLWMEYLPRQAKYRDWPKRKEFLGFYLPACEPRLIAEDAFIHHSVIERLEKVSDYKPENLPKKYQIIYDEEESSAQKVSNA
jgi:uncharacterized protein (DUF2235 family)